MSIDFAVHHEGIPEGSGRWVLHVDAAGDRFLLCDENKQVYWVPIASCTFMMAHTPEQPTIVLAVQPNQQNGLVMPEPNRNMRRNGGF